jgi:hypothetical protein
MWKYVLAWLPMVFIAIINGPASAGQALTMGLVWLGMTVAFEFLFGHYVVKRPWSELLNDYNLVAGRVWLVVLAWITLVPYLFYRLQQ